MVTLHLVFPGVVKVRVVWLPVSADAFAGGAAATARTTSDNPEISPWYARPRRKAPPKIRPQRSHTRDRPPPPRRAVYQPERRRAPSPPRPTSRLFVREQFGLPSPRISQTALGPRDRASRDGRRFPAAAGDGAVRRCAPHAVSQNAVGLPCCKEPRRSRRRRRVKRHASIDTSTGRALHPCPHGRFEACADSLAMRGTAETRRCDRQLRRHRTAHLSPKD